MLVVVLIVLAAINVMLFGPPTARDVSAPKLQLSWWAMLAAPQGELSWFAARLHCRGISARITGSPIGINSYNQKLFYGTT